MFMHGEQVAIQLVGNIILGYGISIEAVAGQYSQHHVVTQHANHCTQYINEKCTVAY